MKPSANVLASCNPWLQAPLEIEHLFANLGRMTTGAHTKALNFSDAAHVQMEGPDMSLLHPTLQKQWDHALPSKHWQHGPIATAGWDQRDRCWGLPTTHVQTTKASMPLQCYWLQMLST